MSAPFSPMAKHLLRIARVGGDLLPMDWPADSPASVQQASLQFAGMGAKRPAHEAALLPLLMLGHTLDHVRGLAATLEAANVVFSSMSLVRPALESASTVFYLIDPDVDERERIRRWANVDLGGNVERIRMLDRESELHDMRIEFGSRLSKLTEPAKRAGFTVTAKPHRFGMIGERYLEPRSPSDQQRIVDLLDDAGGSATGRLVHRMTSAVAHGGVQGLVLFIIGREAEDRGDGSAFVPIGQSFENAALWTAPLLWGLRRCFQRAGTFYGWDTTRWDKAMTVALLDWSEWIRYAKVS